MSRVVAKHLVFRYFFPLLLAPDSRNSLQLSRLARINWAVYSEEGESSPAADKTALDDDILIGLSNTFVFLLGSFNHTGYYLWNHVACVILII